MPRSRIAAAVVAATTVLLGSGSAAAFVLDFEQTSFIGETLVHGTVIDGTYQAADSGINVGISAVNNGGGPDFAVVFDSRLTGTADPDLEDPFSGPAAGNPYSTSPGDSQSQTSYEVSFVQSEMARPGNILIVQENNNGCSDGVCNDPDDEAGGPNTISFDFTDGPITAKSIDLFDLNGGGANETATISLFSDLGGTQLIDSITVKGDDLGGDNRAGRLLFTSFSANGIENVSKIAVQFSGSGATGNLVYVLPSGTPPQGIMEPGSLALLASGVAGLAVIRRRRGRR